MTLKEAEYCTRLRLRLPNSLKNIAKMDGDTPSSFIPPPYYLVVREYLRSEVGHLINTFSYGKLAVDVILLM